MIAKSTIMIVTLILFLVSSSRMTPIMPPDDFSFFLSFPFSKMRCEQRRRKKTSAEHYDGRTLASKLMEESARHSHY